MSSSDVVITGIGLVSALGEGVETHRAAFSAPPGRPPLEEAAYAPYTVHPLPAIDWNLQIAKRGDQRQMETWQRLGTYTAGLALDDAGIKADEALCASMDMVVAAGGGERDEAVDLSILAASDGRDDIGVLVNEKLTTELRPTLFLAQLSNLLAGNISIVHKVTGSSRTFMGEEGAGVAAIETAAARIRSGQSTHVLVGGAFQTEHNDMLLGYELGSHLHRGRWKPVWQRQGMEGGGVVTGSGGAFLVLESREHAEKRGARAYARLGAVASDRLRRQGDYAAGLKALAGRAGSTKLAVSGASGAHAATGAEKKALDGLGCAIRAFSTLTGHLKEAQFPFAVALAALAVQDGKAFPPLDPGAEQALDGEVRAVLATAVGYHRSEGMALVERA
ncbi:MAG: beta-ketoacyl-ACP synthase [Rhizobiaceae bacterium]